MGVLKQSSSECVRAKHEQNRFEFLKERMRQSKRVCKRMNRVLVGRGWGITRAAEEKAGARVFCPARFT